MRPSVRTGACLGRLSILSLLLPLSFLPATAAVQDTLFSDVTARSFSVVWASDEAVTAADIRVFSDALGTIDITAGLSVDVVSTAFPGALTRGIVKVSVAGVATDTIVYVQTETTGASGTVLFPPAPPFLEVRTAVRAGRAGGALQPIANDLLRHELLDPDGVTPATGALVVADVPSLGDTPLTAFLGDGFASPFAVVDLNNLFDQVTGISVEVPVDTILTLTEFRGLDCPGLTDHKLLRYRRVPPHEEIPAVGSPITEVETPVLCFFADVLCDDTVNVLDVQRVLNFFDRTAGNCSFHPDLDIVVDGVINILDVQSVLNRFGESAPFTP